LRYWMRMWSRRTDKKATSSWRRRRRMNRRWSSLTFHYTWSNSIKFDLEMKLIHTSLRFIILDMIVVQICLKLELQSC
jgi:hypothetical protein